MKIVSWRKYRDADWDLNENDNGTVPTSDAHLSVLMDIRDELRGIRRRLDCHETLAIPRLLREIRTATNRIQPRKKKAKVKP